MSGVVELEQAGRTFGSGQRPILALDGVTLSIAAGTFVAVMGTTGSGKSTLLHCAAGLDRPSSGTVRLCQRDLGRMSERALARLRRERIGFVFQSYNLLSELSGGQRQRVAVARALITGPEVLFTDEPTGALDPSTGRHILGLLRSAVDEQGVTVVMVTHDPLAVSGPRCGPVAMRRWGG